MCIYTTITTLSLVTIFFVFHRERKATYRAKLIALIAAISVIISMVSVSVLTSWVFDCFMTTDICDSQGVTALSRDGITTCVTIWIFFSALAFIMVF